VESSEPRELPEGFRFGARVSTKGCVLYLERLLDEGVSERASIEIYGISEFEGACRELVKKAREIERCERLAAEVGTRLHRQELDLTNPPTAS
jgi:hypothetical protein